MWMNYSGGYPKMQWVKDGGSNMKSCCLEEKVSFTIPNNIMEIGTIGYDTIRFTVEPP